MQRRLKIIVPILGAFVGAVIVWQVARLREPHYRGRSLSVWLQSFNPDGASLEADKALSQIGTNAIPTLLAMLRANDSPLKLKLISLKLGFQPAKIQHALAEKGFRALKSDASSAVPSLVEIYQSSGSESARRATANALVAVGLSSQQAIPALVRIATDTNAASNVRALTAHTLGRIGFEPEAVGPVLIKLLHDPDREVRTWAAFGIISWARVSLDPRAVIPGLMEVINLKGGYAAYASVRIRAEAVYAVSRTQAEPSLIVPLLRKYLSDPEREVRLSAVDGLGLGLLRLRGPDSGRPYAASLVVPALAEALGDADVSIRLEAIELLAEVGAAARPAIPALLRRLDRPDRLERVAITNALREIDAEAAAKAGVK